MIKKFSQEKDSITREEHKGKHLFPVCETFDRSAFDALLQREDCKGVRIYYGMKEDSQHIHAVIVGVDAEGKDLLPVAGIAMDGTDAVIIENSQRCPIYCPPSSALNT